MEVRRYEVTLHGRTPLIMNHNNLDWRDHIKSLPREKGAAGDDRSPADKWKGALYMSDTHVVMPVENVMASLMKAGAKIPEGKGTLKSQSQAIFFDDPMMKFTTTGGKQIARTQIEAISGPFAQHVVAAKALGFVLYVKPANRNRKSHVSVRPRFETWSAYGVFETDEDALTDERLRTLFEIAGRISGLGDWRPSSPMKPGSFGRFVSEVKRI